MAQNDGKSYRVLTEEEYLREWEPIRARIFAEVPKGVRRFPSWRPFAPEDWQIVVCAGNLGDTDFLFHAELLPERDRSPWAWADDGGLMFEALRAWGVTEMAMTGRSYWTCPQPTLQPEDEIGVCDAVLCRPTMDSVYEVLSDASAVYDDALWVFDRSRERGLFSVHDPSMRLLAGTTDFMDAYLAQAGGLAAVQERFHYMHVADTEFNRIPGDKMDAFYRMPGWEPFEHDFDRHRDWDEIAQSGIRLGRAHPRYMGLCKD